VETRTIIVALVVGVLVTVLASLRPAMRATRVEPIAAVREGATLPEGRFARYRTAGSAAATVLGFAAVLVGLFAASGTGAVLALMGLGADGAGAGRHPRLAERPARRRDGPAGA